MQVQSSNAYVGPIVRINPHEVHICDAQFYEEIYASSQRRREKDPKWVGTFPMPTSMVATVGHEHHRFRRNILNSYFSKRSVQKLAPRIESRIQRLMHRLKEQGSQSAMRVDSAFAALTADTVTEYLYGKSIGFLQDEHFGIGIRNAINTGASMVHIARFIPSLFKFMRKLPLPVTSFLNPGVGTLYTFQDSLYNGKPTKDTAGETTSTMLESLTGPSIPPHERTLARIQDEGLAIILAGTDTTARVLTVATFHLGRDRSLLLWLRGELTKNMPDFMASNVAMPSLADLEKLPYLVSIWWIMRTSRIGADKYPRRLLFWKHSVSQTQQWPDFRGLRQMRHSDIIIILSLQEYVLSLLPLGISKITCLTS